MFDLLTIGLSKSKHDSYIYWKGLYVGFNTAFLETSAEQWYETLSGIFWPGEGALG